MRRIDPETVVKNVGARVAEFRRSKGLTQEALADGLKISPGYVRKVEQGNANMTLYTLVRWANWLEVEIIELLMPPKGEPGKRVSRHQAR